jgi:hypothetical protein
LAHTLPVVSQGGCQPQLPDRVLRIAAIRTCLLELRQR